MPEVVHMRLPAAQITGQKGIRQSFHAASLTAAKVMVERFNGHIAELVNQTRFASTQELETTLGHYLKTFHHLIPERALHHQLPIQALKEWQRKKTELFVKRVYEQSGLDS